MSKGMSATQVCQFIPTRSNFHKSIHGKYSSERQGEPASIPSRRNARAKVIIDMDQVKPNKSWTVDDAATAVRASLSHRDKPLPPTLVSMVIAAATGVTQLASQTTDKPWFPGEDTCSTPTAGCRKGYTWISGPIPTVRPELVCPKTAGVARVMGTCWGWFSGWGGSGGVVLGNRSFDVG
jgi:hypothetical protein